MSVYQLMKWIYKFMPDCLGKSQPVNKLKNFLTNTTVNQSKIKTPRDKLEYWFNNIWIPSLSEDIDRAPIQSESPGSLAGSKTEKAKILFIVDSPCWAHDFKTDNIMCRLNHVYHMEKAYCDQVTTRQIQAADLIFIYYWRQLYQKENMHKMLSILQKKKSKIVMGITSHTQLRGNFYEPGIAVLKEIASGISMISKLLMQEFGHLFDVPVFYTPNGVDTDFFVPAEKPNMTETLKIGWAGSRSNHGNLRGYDEFLVPAIKQVDGVELLTAAREDMWRDKQQMREFYQELDLYICASSSEGTPNPCLEAMACGIPVLTTPVGSMPELIESGINGYFISRDIQNITDKIRHLQRDRFLLNQLRLGARDSIRSWDWKIKAKNYQKLFMNVLNKMNTAVN